MRKISLGKIDKLINTIAAFIFAILVIFIIAYTLIFNGGISSLHSNWGQFGDFIGGIFGSLLSLFAVILLYSTYILQREELSKTAEALENQNEQMKIQQFENIVFKLIDRKDTVLHSMRHKSTDGIVALKHLNNDIKSLVDDRGMNRMKALQHFWKDKKPKIWPYFNSVITTIGFIKTYGVNDVERARLTKIYFSYFTLHEIRLLNDLFKIHQGEPKYKDAIIYFEQNNSEHL